MLSLAVSGYTSAQVDAALHAGHRTWGFRYDLLDDTATLKQPVSAYSLVGPPCTVTNDTTAKVRRTCKATLLDDSAIAWGHDQLRPYARLRMPDGGVAEWPLGTFLLSTAPKLLAGGVVARQVDGYDYNQILLDDHVTDRYSVTAGSVVTTAVTALLTSAGITRQNVTTSTQTLPVTREWALGTDKLTIVTALLAAINYNPLWFDALGVAQVQPFIALTSRPVEYGYADDAGSVIFASTAAGQGMTDGADYFAVPNVFVGLVTLPDRQTLKSTYTNNNPASPTSTLARGRSIVAVNNAMDAVDQTTLAAAVARWAAQASQVNEEVRWYSAIMPHHADSDCYSITNSRLGTTGSFIESRWQLNCQPGALPMQHAAKAIIPV